MVDDTATTDEDVAVNINVLANDTFNPTSTVAVTGTTAPSNGSVVINPDGTVTYTPNADFNGTDTFDYTVTLTNADGSTTTETATVTVTVNPIANVVDDTATTDEDVAVNINVLANDTFNPTSTVAVTGTTAPSNGSVVINPDGTVTYTPNADFNGTDTFDYTVTLTNADGSTTTETATVTVTVIDEGNPTAVDDFVETIENITVTTPNVLVNDTVIDGATITSFDSTSANGGGVVSNGDGTFDYTPALDFYGNDVFTYEICDDDTPPSCSTASVFITVIQDTDGDGIPNIDDIDDDNDGITDVEEQNGDPTLDTDGDGIIDSEDLDADGDGIFDVEEAGHSGQDVDGDGMLDGPVGVNGLPDEVEGGIDGNGPDYTPQDSDGDGIDDFQDVDDDNDGIHTANENPDPNGNGEPSDAQDSDNDGIPDYLDIDDDGDGVDTVDENPDTNDDGNPSDAQDTDNDGIPDYLDIDDDGDSVNTADENPDPNGDGNPSDAQDTDEDGIPDYLDIDDDGDGINTIDEDNNGDGDPRNDDCDRDTTPDYLDTDSCDFIPDVFTPNGDGYNDTFVIPALANYPNFKLTIYNRYGNIVYKYANKGRVNPIWWDGHSTGRMTINKNKIVPVGTYFYIIDFNDDTKKPLQGWIYLNK